MNKNSFDYLIIGGGLAGLQLALALLNDNYFSNKRIGLIEPSAKNQNDKTWCFWEKGSGNWEHLLHHHWDTGKVGIEKDCLLNLEMQGYSYKMIRSIDFYQYAREKINASNQIQWINDKVLSIDDDKAIGEKASYLGSYIFDSRIDSNFFSDKKSIKLIQHFKGWTIETKMDFFNPSQFIMMDFSIIHEGSCCFTYLLPYSTKKALVEFTFFTPQLVEDSTYDQLLKEYLNQKLGIIDYTLLEEEKGQIPMSTYPFHQSNGKHYLKIGTAGGWVKPSSGYSFKNTEKKVGQILDSLKEGKPLEKGLKNSRHEFYDHIFLRILQDENHLGNQLFKQMYSRNSAAAIFKFLDEESKLLEELKIINSFDKAPFLRSLKKFLIKN